MWPLIVQMFVLTWIIGSTTVYPYNDTSLRPIELGASIFVKANKNMWRASEEFNLTRRDFKDQDFETGIWDGEQFLLSVRDTLAILQLVSLNASTVQRWMVGHPQDPLALRIQCSAQNAVCVSRLHITSAQDYAYTRLQSQVHDRLIPLSLYERNTSVESS